MGCLEPLSSSIKVANAEFVSERADMAVACRIIGILPPCQITWVKRISPALA
jgi:hypothetical protein